MRRPARRLRTLKAAARASLAVPVAAAVLLFVGGLALAAALHQGQRAAGPTTTTGTDQTSTGATGTGQTSTGSTTVGLPTTGTTTGQTDTGPTAAEPTDRNSPAARYSVINATVNAASDHEILGSSAFPNYATGAVDNYYSLAHTHVDNSPFAEGTASPADTGPVGQTAAAGNAQQPQYADARWPGDPSQASFGNQGGPYASAQASDYSATAESSAASNDLSGTGGTSRMDAIAVPKGFDGRLRQRLRAWKAKWLGRLHLKVTVPGAPKGTGGIKVPTTVPSTTVTTPVGTVTTPAVTVPGLPTTPSVTVPTVSVPSVTVPKTPLPVPPAPTVSVPSVSGPQAAPSRSLAQSSGGASQTGAASKSGGTPSVPVAQPAAPKQAAGNASGAGFSGDGAAVIASTTKTGLDSSGAVSTTGESVLKRVSIGGGQILVEGIHVTASLTNAGSQPECAPAFDQGGATDTTGTTTDTGTTTGATTTSPIPTPPATPTGTGTTTTTPDQGGAAPSGQDCPVSSDQGGAATTTGSTTTDTTGTTTSTTTTTTPTTTSPSDGGGGAAPADKVTVTISGVSIGGVPVTIDQDGVHVAGQGQPLPYQQASDALNAALKQAGVHLFLVTPEITASANEKTVTATGLHVVFTQPMSPPGVPAQYVEHILGEVFVDSLAVPGVPIPSVDFSGSGADSGQNGQAAGGTTTTPGGTKGKPAGGSKRRGGASAGGTTGFSSSSPSSYSSGSSQPTSSYVGGSGDVAAAQPVSSPTGSTQQSIPQAFVSALRKPVWLLVAYLVWQALVIATGASLWSWRKGGTA